MRNRVLLSAGAIALLATSCAQPEPQVLSEAPRSVTTAELASPSQTAEEESPSGRFIARCATEADGGTPGMTYFTDGSQIVTDHCLSRYYIGVQPAPGALYVPDEAAGSLAPPRETAPSGSPATSQWTPAQPRTDADPEGVPGTDETRPGEESTSETTEPGSEENGGTTTSPGETSPTTPTTPTTPGTTTPGTTGPEPGEPGPDTQAGPRPPPRVPRSPPCRPRSPPPRSGPRPLPRTRRRARSSLTDRSGRSPPAHPRPR